MIVKVPTRHEELTLIIKLFTNEPTKIRIKVIDEIQQDTSFTDRYKTVDGETIFYVRMPVSPQNALVYIYNEDKGNLMQDQDDTFEVESITKGALEKKLANQATQAPVVKANSAPMQPMPAPSAPSAPAPAFDAPSQPMQPAPSSFAAPAPAPATVGGKRNRKSRNNRNKSKKSRGSSRSRRSRSRSN
jgi:hypothetical protein